MIVVALPLLLCGWLVADTRARALDAAKADMRRVSAVAAEQVTRLLEVQALVLDLADREAAGRSCAELQGDERLRDFMATAVRRAAQTEVAWVLDAAGFQCVGSDPARVDNVSRAFREYFASARDGGPGRYSVDRGVIGIPSGTPAFTISRARGDGGAFVGVIVAAVGLRDLIASWRGLLGVEQMHRVALFRSDGVLIARSFEPLVAPPNPIAERAVAQTWQNEPEGARVVVAMVDGTERVSAWRMIPRWGVVVTSSVAKAEALRPWWRFAVLATMAAALVSALLAYIAARFTRAGRHLERTNTELEQRVQTRTAEVQESEARLRALFASLDEGFCLCEMVLDDQEQPVDYRFLEINPLFEAMTGLKNAAGRTALELVPDLERHWVDTYARVAIGGETLRFEQHSEAMGRSYDVFATPVAPPGRFAVIFRDVTARRQAERALAESEEVLRLSQEAAGVASYVQDLPKAEIRWAPNAQTLLGFPSGREAMRGDELFAILHPEDAARNQAERAVYFQNGVTTARYECRITRPDTGALRHLEVRTRVEYDDDGSPLRSFGLVLDVTERKQAEAALATSEARWRTLFERMHEGLFRGEVELGPDGRPVDFWFLEVNAAFEVQSGLSAVAVLGRRVSEALPGLEPFWLETYGKVAVTGQPAQFEHRAAALGRWFEVRAYQTEPGRFAALFLDITKRKSLEQRQALLMMEVDHRAKNALAVVQSVIGLTRAQEPKEFRAVINGRIAALARAHTLLADTQWGGVELHALLEKELAAYQTETGGVLRAVLKGPPVLVAADAAQPLAMALHELATNAAKYGGLSSLEGQVVVTWQRESADGTLVVEWLERNGPVLSGPPEHRGFGSSLIERTVERQLQGSVTFTWGAGGLCCRITLPEHRVLDQGGDQPASIS